MVRSNSWRVRPPSSSERNTISAGQIQNGQFMGQFLLSLPLAREFFAKPWMRGAAMGWAEENLIPSGSLLAGIDTSMSSSNSTAGTVATSAMVFTESKIKILDLPKLIPCTTLPPLYTDIHIGTCVNLAKLASSSTLSIQYQYRVWSMNNNMTSKSVLNSIELKL